MKKWALLFASVFLASFEVSIPAAIAATPAHATQVPIPRKHRVRNQTGIQCVWASLECLARQNGVKPAMNLTACYKGQSDPVTTAWTLHSLGVRYCMQMPGNRDTWFLETACGNGWGACAGLNSQHMINVIHFKDGIVKVIDNLDPQLRVQVWTERQFLSLWDGWAITLIPPGTPR